MFYLFLMWFFKVKKFPLIFSSSAVGRCLCTCISLCYFLSFKREAFLTVFVMFFFLSFFYVSQSVGVSLFSYFFSSRGFTAFSFLSKAKRFYLFIFIFSSVSETKRLFISPFFSRLAVHYFIKYLIINYSLRWRFSVLNHLFSSALYLLIHSFISQTCHHLTYSKLQTQFSKVKQAFTLDKNVLMAPQTPST